MGGFTTERLIRASADGKMEPAAKIGDMVEKDQIVAWTGNRFMQRWSGIVRGMLQKGCFGHRRTENRRYRCQMCLEYCITISDKAKSGRRWCARLGICLWTDLWRSMESHFWQQENPDDLEAISCRKNSESLYRHALEKLEAFSGLSRVVVTAREALAREAQRLGIHIAENRHPELELHLGCLALQELLSQDPELEGVLFLVCDQPGIQAATIQKILKKEGMPS